MTSINSTTRKSKKVPMKSKKNAHPEFSNVTGTINFLAK